MEETIKIELTPREFEIIKDSLVECEGGLESIQEEDDVTDYEKEKYKEVIKLQDKLSSYDEVKTQ